MTCAGIQLLVIWNGQRFLSATLIYAPQFDVAPALRKNGNFQSTPQHTQTLPRAG
jgi:hypothetical protein